MNIRQAAALCGLSILVSFSASAATREIDYDGDGLTDLAAYEVQNDGSANEVAITWRSSKNQSVNRFEFGKKHEAPVPADYDGDGITDAAVVGLNELDQFLWRIKFSSDKTIVSSIFGNIDDLVFYGCSFDNDNKADRAVLGSNGMFYYEKSSDLSVSTFALGVSNLQYLTCADLNGDGVDEVIAQKTVDSNVKKKSKRSKRKRDTLKLIQKSFFYVWDAVSGTRIQEIDFGKSVKGIFTADIDGDGSEELGYQRELTKSKKVIAFYLGGNEIAFEMPAFSRISFQNYSSSGSGPADGFLVKVNRDDTFLRFNSVNDLVNFETVFLNDTQTLLPARGAINVGPIRSREPICNNFVDPYDGNEGFLWKPVSDTQTTSVVVLPPAYRYKKLTIIKDGKLIEKLRYGGNANGGRDHWRSANRYTFFPTNITIAGTKAGVTSCWLIQDPSQRVD